MVRYMVIVVMVAVAMAVSGGTMRSTAQPAAVQVKVQLTVQEELELGIDPLPATEFVEVPPEMTAAQRARALLVGRLAKGILKVGRNKGGGRWWECGVRIPVEREFDTAIEWAYRVVSLAWDYSDIGSTMGYQLNPWEIAGVAANECGFDRCALGKYPRRWGYQHGTMKRSKLGISHTYEDIERTLTDPRGEGVWTTSGLDGAPLHVLWKCKDGVCWPKFNREGLPPIPMREVFSLGMGFEYNVREFKKRAIDHKTQTPSLYWKGYPCDWYREKILNWQKRLGATPREISGWSWS